MAVTRKDLGIATAYGYAKSKGYTGTEEEFALLMKSYAEVAEEAREAADDAEDARDAITAMGVSCETLEPGSPATVQKIVDGLGTVTLKFGIPEGADGDVTGDVIADEYSASKTYAVGDHVMKSGHYYVCKTAITTAEAWTAAHWTEVAVGDEVTDLKSHIDDIANTEEYTESIEISYSPEWTVGFIEPSNGRIYTGGSYNNYESYTSVSVQEGDIVEAFKGSTAVSMRTVCAYLNGSVVAAKGEPQAVSSYTVPSGVDAVGMCVNAPSNNAIIRITRASEATSTTLKRNPIGYMRDTGDLSAGDKIVLPVHDVKAGNVIAFSGRITEFSSIKIGKNVGEYPYLIVDGTNITLYNNGNTPTVTTPHGLTIADDIQVTMFGNNAASIKRVEVASKGNEYIYASTFYWDISISGAWYVESIGSILTDCAFSWTNTKINAPIWIFGDSYIGFGAKRWPYYLVRDGLDNSVMLNGFSGEGSAGAYNSLVTLLNVCVPKIVVWTMGMNNGDTSSAVNATWKMYYERVLSLSKKYGFQIVLYTVPTTPAVNNNYKNAIVRASGYRYVEADKAVRIDGSTSWISGTLDTDNTHPTEAGAKILFHRFTADLPELAFYANIPDS